jgi:hypothetical protein
MLKVKFHRTNIFLPALCVTCGARYIKEAVEAALWKDNQRIGSICQECIRMCSEGLSQVLRKHSQSLKERASVLEELSHQPIECPPWEEYLQALAKEKSKESEEARPQMIMSRVMLIGEDIIPKEELEGLAPNHIRIFLTEFDPAKWPTEILHLRKYTEQEIE